jgi:hypothetical protein
LLPYPRRATLPVELLCWKEPVFPQERVQTGAA